MNSTRMPDVSSNLTPQGRPPLSRRTFLTRSLGLATLGAAAPHLVPSHVLGGKQPPPSETLTLVAVGIDGMGQNCLEACKTARVVALCDADHNFAGKVFGKYPGATRYKDFRRMFDRESKNFDALIIGKSNRSRMPAVLVTRHGAKGRHPELGCAEHYDHDAELAPHGNRVL